MQNKRGKSGSSQELPAAKKKKFEQLLAEMRTELIKGQEEQKAELIKGQEEQKAELKAMQQKMQKVLSSVKRSGSLFLSPPSTSQGSSSSPVPSRRRRSGRTSARDHRMMSPPNPNLTPIGSSGLLMDSASTTGVSASNLLQMSNIDDCSLIYVKHVTEKSIPPYDLKGVFDKEPDMNMATTLALYKNQVSGKTSSEYPVLLYLLHLLDKYGQEVRSFYSFVDFKVAESFGGFQARLNPLLTSLDIKPDTSMAVRFCGDCVSFFFTEMHSGTSKDSYENTVAKAVSNLVDMHRLLKIYAERPNVYAFVFPKYGEKSCVTALESQFSAIPPKFTVTLKKLSPSDVHHEVVKVLKKLPNVFSNPHSLHHSYFVRLTEQDLQEFGTFVGASEKCTQMVSSNSIVVTDTRNFWKCIIQDREALAVMNVMTGLRDFKHVVKYDYIGKPNLFVTPAKLEPLKPVCAKSCLFDLSNMIKVALEALHQLNYAHLDVRLPNVCFELVQERGQSGTTCIVVLIDIDRTQDASECKQPYFSGEYYVKPPQWTLDKLDWKQLGLTIRALTGDGDPFINTLIDDGIWQEQQYTESSLLKNNQTFSRFTVMEVIQRRIASSQQTTQTQQQ